MTASPPAAPLAPRNPQGKPAAARLGEITGVAILCIGVGGMGTLCCGIGQFASLFLQQSPAFTVRLPDGSLLQPEPGVTAFTGAIAMADLVSSVALILVGITALRLMPIARRAGIAVAIAMLVIASVFVVGTALYTGPAREAFEKRRAEIAAETATTQPTTAPSGPPPLAPFASTGTFVSGALFFLVRTLVPLLILVLWTRPQVWRAFAGIGEPI